MPRTTAGPHRRARRTPARAAALGAAMLVGLGAAACSSPSGASIPAPKGLPSFYSVPSPLPSGPIGTLIKSEPVAAAGVHGHAYRVMYVSETVRNQRAAVTGLVFVPDAPPPAGGYPVVSWGHGTNGMADSCAPSLSPTDAVPSLNALLDRGWEVTASDYVGEGTPGLMPYLVGVSAARDTVNIVRAARHMPAAHASADYVVWGHSEGGQTAMFSLEIGQSYAPELHLEGVVAGAPPSQFKYVYDFLITSPFRFYLFMAAGGFNAGYGNQAAPLSEVLTPKGISLLPLLDEGCSDFLAAQTSKYPISEITTGNPWSHPAWQKLLNENDPESMATAVAAPLLIIQGGNDEQIPVVSTQLLDTHLCSIHQDTERWIYPGRSHSGVIAPSTPDMVQWIADRFTGAANPDPYHPTGQPDVTTSSCP